MTQRVHLIFKTHLDVGFTDYASVVVENYFKKYIPASLRVARQMRDSDRTEQFIWTTGSWLIYEYLEQASPLERAEMEAAIELGEISWHALPFTTHTELMDVGLYQFGLSLSQILDRRFGRKTIAAKLTDVPGHTRGIVPLLAQAGVIFLHVGVNPGSTIPGVPPLFRWQDESGAEVIVMYESGYGSAFTIAGLEDVLAFGHTMDNMGPQSPDQVIAVYREKRAQFPGAEVFASTLDQFAARLATIRHTLPVFSGEIGDTWIHGIGSDPIKVSRYRELLRLRSAWLQKGATSESDPTFFNFNRRLLLVPEHTWGMDEKTFLGDHENYSAEKFAAVRNLPHFKKFESSWVEKRTILQNAINALEDSPLSGEARVVLDRIRPVRPDLSKWVKIPKGKIKVEGKACTGLFEADKPSLREFQDKQGRLWADGHHPLGKLSYQTFSAADYDRFFHQYILPSQQVGDWAREDFCKPGLEQANPPSRMWEALAVACYHRKTETGDEVMYRMAFAHECHQKYGAPQELYLTFGFEDDFSGFLLDLQWFGKQACRMPEAFWLGFNPLPVDGKWWMDKLGKRVSPLEVVENGNRHLHAVGNFVEFNNANGTLKITPYDSPLVAPGAPSLLDFNNQQPKLDQGMHFCLLNNLWGTNFPMWFEEDCRFRFCLELQPTHT